MNIARLDAYLLSFPLPEPVKLRYFGGERTIIKRDALLIRVETDGGRVGWAPGPCTEYARDRIQAEIGSFLNGRAVTDPDALRVQFLHGPGRDGDLAKLYGSVEIALYDLAAKAKGVPVSELLGGRVRDRIQLYGSAGMYQPPEKYAAEAAGIAELGFPAYKMRSALGPEEDLRTVRLMREAAPDLGLMVDAHTWWRMGDKSYAPETVARLAEQMAEYDLTWLEEPILPDRHEEYRALRAKDLLPVASGEHEPSEERFLDLIQNECVDYVQMDVLCQGGYAVARRLFGEIEKKQLRFAFHSWGTDLEVIAAAQIGICWPETVVEWLEYPVYDSPKLKTMYPFPLAHEILATPLEIERGELVVPRAPGLGVEINAEVIHKYPWIPGPWSWFELDSPREKFAVIGDHSIKFA